MVFHAIIENCLGNMAIIECVRFEVLTMVTQAVLSVQSLQIPSYLNHSAMMRISGDIGIIVSFG